MAVWTPGLRTPVVVPSSCTVAWHGLSYPIIRFSPGLRQPSSFITHAAPSVFGSLLNAVSVLSQLLKFSGKCYCIRSITAPGVFWSKLLHPFYHSSWRFLVSATASVLSQLLAFSGQNCCIRSIIAPGVFWSVLLHPFYHSSWRFLVKTAASSLSHLLVFSGHWYYIRSVTASNVFCSILLHSDYPLSFAVCVEIWTSLLVVCVFWWLAFRPGVE